MSIGQLAPVSWWHLPCFHAPQAATAPLPVQLLHCMVQNWFNPGPTTMLLTTRWRRSGVLRVTDLL